MKDKLEVGHFIRTIKGIGRIEEITEDRTEIYFNCDTGLTISFIKKDFTQEEMAQYYKHSDNIIDLIEVGDYVNGSKVIDISIIGKDKEKWVWVEQMEDSDNKYGDDYVGYNNDQIKSIVTKEQFSSMEYRLGDDK